MAASRTGRRPWPRLETAPASSDRTAKEDRRCAYRLAYATRPALSLEVIWSVYAVDAQLTPMGVGFAALACAITRLVLPLCLSAVLILFALALRAHRWAIELHDAYRGTALVLGEALGTAGLSGGGLPATL